MEKDNYMFLANHLRDIHHYLESKILDSRTHSPKWPIQKEGGEEIVIELSPLFKICVLLEKLANPPEPQQLTFINPDDQGGE